MKSLVGERLEYVEHEKPNMSSFFQKRRLHTQSGSFTLGNRVDWLTTISTGRNASPHFVFSKSEDEMKINLKLGKHTIMETIKDIILIDDHLEVPKGKRSSKTGTARRASYS